MELGLKDKVALVTGAGRYLGREIALAFAEEGCRTVVVDIDGERAENVVKEIESKGVEGMAVVADVSKKDQVESMVAKTVDSFGQLDILVNNAALGGKQGPWEDLSESEWEETLDVNARGVFLCNNEVAKQMKKQQCGRIISIASPAGLKGEPYNGIYSVSKCAVISMTQSFALELAQHGITVNAVCPGAMLETDMIKHVFRDRSKYFGISPEEMEEKVRNNFPLPGKLEFEDIANLVVFLASSKASKISGQAISVTGGKTVN